MEGLELSNEPDHVALKGQGAIAAVAEDEQSEIAALDPEHPEHGSKVALIRAKSAQRRKALHSNWMPRHRSTPTHDRANSTP
jgi:hypothetical protein